MLKNNVYFLASKGDHNSLVTHLPLYFIIFALFLSLVIYSIYGIVAFSRNSLRNLSSPRILLNLYSSFFSKINAVVIIEMCLLAYSC